MSDRLRKAAQDALRWFDRIAEHSPSSMSAIGSSTVRDELRAALARLVVAVAEREGK